MKINIFNFFKKKHVEIPVIKMYVLARADMSPINQAVQSGHAVAEYMKHFYYRTIWRNGVLVYLSVPNESTLNQWEAKLKAADIDFATFVEPDWGDPTKTALAFCTTSQIAKELPLMKI